MKNINLENLKKSLSEKSLEKSPKKQAYKILIVDDDVEVHKVSKMLLKKFEFDRYGIKIIDAYSAKEALRVLKKEKDIAVIYLDVVMETEHSGLDLVKKIREDFNNHMIRIILRTGQPGQAPEGEVVKKYDINDYILKTDLTMKKLHISLYTALRNYRDILSIEKHRRGLEKIIIASGRLFNSNSLDDFLNSILQELSAFQKEDNDLIYIREKDSNGFVTMKEKEKNIIVAATGRFEQFIGQEVRGVGELKPILNYIESLKLSDKRIMPIENGFIIMNNNSSGLKNFIFIEGKDTDFDINLIEVFLSNFSVALDNYILNRKIKETQSEIVFALAETIESHFDETGSHIKRISSMMYKFSLLTHASYQEAELIKLASTMHDLGKIAIPDRILKKPGKLTADEFKVIMTHPYQGYKILSKSELPVLKLAAEIALNHHEKFDGSGYPNGIKGLDIPWSARMMAIVDVFDALSHKRVYKDAMAIDKAIVYLLKEKGKHFDPKLVDIFVENFEEIYEED